MQNNEMRLTFTILFKQLTIFILHKIENINN